MVNFKSDSLQEMSTFEKSSDLCSKYFFKKTNSNILPQKNKIITNFGENMKEIT